MTKQMVNRLEPTNLHKRKCQQSITLQQTPNQITLDLKSKFTKRTITYKIWTEQKKTPFYTFITKKKYVHVSRLHIQLYLVWI